MSDTSQYPDINPDKAFWDHRWEQNETGWDIGHASPAIVEYMKQHTNKEAAILIPGCGNAYEAEYLAANGYKNISLIDISAKACDMLQAKFENNTSVRIFCEDFFSHTGSYDLILEQTFFCAISPSLRKEYVKKCAELLKPKGKLVGVLFNTIFEKSGPPFGGKQEEYEDLFKPHFTINTMALCHNSITPRLNNELFICLTKL